MVLTDFPIEKVRRSFPALEDRQDRSFIYLDGPGGTQMVRACIDRMTDYFSNGMANLGGSFPTSIHTGDLIEEARSSVAQLLHCEAREVAFGQNMTSLAFQVSQGLRQDLKPGDEIVVTQLDHRANVDPWLILARETGARIRFIPVDPVSLTLDLSELDTIVNDKTKIVAAGLSSNLTGTVSDLEPLFERARKMGAISIADAVHAVPHIPVDFPGLGCDILFCSAYKFFGPHLGIVVLRQDLFRDLKVAKLDPAPNTIPWKMETGTQNHEGIAGLCGAIDFIRELGVDGQDPLRTGMERIEAYETAMMQDLEEFFRNIPEIRLYRAPGEIRKTPTFAFTIAGIHSRKATTFFAENYNLCVGDGNFYASTMAEVFPVMDAGGWIRIGLAPYNTMDEIAVFKKAVRSLISTHKSA